VQGNRELIGQAIFNLIDNAIKYSDGGRGKSGEVSLSLIRRPDAICLQVADRGPGIPAESGRTC
jgi:signal transduction histidine kinase